MTVRAGRLWPAALRRIPTAAWVCALIAFLNASAWALIVPPFQGKDEVDHFAYVEQLAESGTLPENGNENGKYSPQESLVLQGLHFPEIAHSPQTPAISTHEEQQILNEDVHAGESLQGSGEAGVATPEPPLYYVLQIVPYELARGNILTQLQLMRLVGALFGAGVSPGAFPTFSDRAGDPDRDWFPDEAQLCGLCVGCVCWLGCAGCA